MAELLAGAGPIPARPLLPGFFQVVTLDADRVALRTAGRVVRLSAPGVGGFAHRLLSAFDGRSSVDDLARRLDLDEGVVRALAARLQEQGVVVEGAGEDQRVVDGNAAVQHFFALLGRPPGPVNAAVSTARLGLIGLGPVARGCVRDLVVAGIAGVRTTEDGRVTETDHAMVATSGRAVGRSRAEVVTEECRDLGRARVSIGASIEWVVDGSDLVVVEVDQAAERVAAVNRACLESGVAMLAFDVTALGAVVGPAVQPFRSPCYACLDNRRFGHLKYPEEHQAFQAGLRDGTVAPGEVSLPPGCASVVAGLVSVEALRVLTGVAPLTVGGVLIVDFRTMEVRREDLFAVPDCPACSSVEPEVTIYR